jgi:hypothetical protein
MASANSSAKIPLSSPMLSRQEQLETAEIAARMAKPLTSLQEERSRQAHIAALQYEIEGAESLYRSACRKLGKANRLCVTAPSGLGRRHWQAEAFRDINKTRRVLMTRKAELSALTSFILEPLREAA